MILIKTDWNWRLLVFAGYLLTFVIADYKVGIGISDVTGPVVEVTFMGYAKAKQKGTGLHLRQFARAFIIDDDKNVVVFVSVDAAMIGHGIRKQVLAALNKKYGTRYNEQNVIISGTHTHSAPGGFMMDLLFDITSFGFVRETFSALVSGISKAIQKAHRSIQSTKIFLNTGIVLDANINRSPASYLLNPEEERSRYQYNVDKDITQLKFVSSLDKKLRGVINWFPVHPTSMNNTNTLISSDNVGYASILLEQYMNKNEILGKGPFVAAFASTNLGDVSPNTNGPHCLNTGRPCDEVTSSCNGQAKLCVAFGPGKNMYDSTKIIAERLFTKALQLLNDDASEITGAVKAAHQFIDMPNQVTSFTFPNSTTIKVRGCLPAMGYSFAAGTTDGPGEFDFKQGTTSTNMLWNTIRNFIAAPTIDDIRCQHPKPILLATGRIKHPYRWQPRIVSVQVAVIGDLVLAAVPGEFTTMAGRRLKNSLTRVMEQNNQVTGNNSNKVIIAGLSNIYSDYIVTPEEYQLQRYEAASTIFGPHTLTIYLDLYSKLLNSVIRNESMKKYDEPPDISAKLISLIPPVIFDWPGWGNNFGDCIQQPSLILSRGDTAFAKFVAGNPRNNLMHDKTFLVVEKMVNQDEWNVIATDANWETKFRWARTFILSGTSVVTIEWTIPVNAVIGTYRIRHFGYYKYVFGGIFSYEGITNVFNVI